MKKIQTIIARIKHWWTRFYWNNKIKRVVKSVSTTDKAIYQTVLTNYINWVILQHQFERSTSSTKALLHTLFKVNKIVLDKLIPTIRPLVGIQPMSSPVGLSYLMQFTESEPGMLSLEIVKHTVEAGTRRLASQWSIEASQDLIAECGLDIENQIADSLAVEIANEIYAELISTAHAIANRHQSHNLLLTTTILQNPDALMVALNKAANNIALTTRRGVANFVLMNSETFSLIFKDNTSARAEMLQTITTEALHTHYKFKIPNSTLGYNIYVTDNIKTNGFLMGYKGPVSEVDAALIYCPYVLVMTAGIVMDPNTFQPVVRSMTRYGLTVLESGSNTPKSCDDYYLFIPIEE